MLAVLCMSLIFPVNVNAWGKHKAGDWLTKDEFFEFYDLDEFLGWGLAGGSVGEKISNSETGLYPVQIKATLTEVILGAASIVNQLASGPKSFTVACDNTGKQFLLSSEPITVNFSGGESKVTTEHGHFSYSYDLTLNNLTYDYSSGFSSLSSPFRINYNATGKAEAFGVYQHSPDDIIQRQLKESISEENISDRMQCAISESGEMILTTVISFNDDYNSGTPGSNTWVKFRVDEVQLGKKPSKSAGMTIKLSSSDTSDDAAPAGPLTTLVISILAILLSILFGNTGGFIPTVPVGTGGAPAPAPADSGLSRWLRFDDDGDIETTDPVNGQRRTFVHNGDDTYTDPVSGATYTPEELSEQMEHRADNSGTIRQDEAQFKQNVSEDRQRNQERSDESRQLEKDLQRERQERTRKEKIERIATDLGMSGASEKQVRDELERRMERDEDYRQKMNDYAQRRDTAVDVLEATVEMADYTMAAGEALVPGGKEVSAIYKGVKNVGSTMMEKGASWGSFTEGAIKGGTEAATTMMDAGIGKAATSFGGTVAGEVAEAVNDGGDLTDALVKGTVKGTFNAASGAVGDAYGDAVGGTYGEILGKDSTIKKVAETAGKLGEVGFEKNVTGKVDDIVHGKD
jgi:hypothetical protein